MADTFRNDDARLITARKAVAFTPHDTNALPNIPRGIFVGTGGDVVLRAVDSQVDVTYKNLSDGAYIAVAVSHVRATGTTAADLIAEY